MQVLLYLSVEKYGMIGREGCLVDTFEWVLLGILVVLGLLASVLRPILAKRQSRPMGVGWVIQGFLFPWLMIAAAIAFLAGGPDLIFPAVILGLLQELIFGFFRKRKSPD